MRGARLALLAPVATGLLAPLAGAQFLVPEGSDYHNGSTHPLLDDGSAQTVLLRLERAVAGGDAAQVVHLVGSLRERLGELVGGGTERTLREPLVRTVHSYAFGVLRLHAARHAIQPAAAGMTAAPAMPVGLVAIGVR